MAQKFDELTKAMAQSVNRRQALRRFGWGMALGVLGMLGESSQAQKAPRGGHGYCHQYCSQYYTPNTPNYDYCYAACLAT